MSDLSVAAELGICRQTINQWRNDPRFIRALNIEKNKLSHKVREQFHTDISGLIAVSIDAVNAAIKGGDMQTVRWFLDRVDIGVAVKQIFEQTVNPSLSPESMDAIIDEISAKQVDKFFEAKGISPTERLRVGPMLKQKLAAKLREEHSSTEDEPKNPH